MDIGYLLSRFWRRFHWFFLVAATISIAAIAVSRVLPLVYESETRLLVEAAQIEDATILVSPEQQLQVVEQRLMTRANLLDIARRQSVFEDIGLMTPDEIVERMREATEIRRRAARGETPVLTIAFNARSGQIASGVLNDYLTVIEQEDVERRTVTAGQTLDFYEEEVDRLAGLLDARSAAILEFQNANADALPETLDARLAQQTSLEERLLQTDRDLSALVQQRQQLLRLFEAAEAAGGALGTPAGTPERRMTPAERELAALRAELQSALALYSSSNPRVTVLRGRVAQAEAAVAAEAGLAPGDAEAAGSVAEAEAARRRALLDAQLAEIDARREALVEQRTDIDERLAEVGELLSRIPANSIVLEGLQREYANVRQQYNDAVAARGAAATGERIEALSRGQRIVVIEPPSTPTSPSGLSPNLVAAGGTALGIGAGIALVVLLEFLNQAPNRPRDIAVKLGVTPFATIPFQPGRGQTIRRRGIKLLVILIGLAGVPAALWAVHSYYRPIDLLARDLVALITP